MSNAYLNEDELEKIFKKHIKPTAYPVSIKTLFGERYTRKINYDPYYQRNYVWDKSKASFFIESILLGTDIPPLIFFNNGSKIEVIDGRQRFETMKRFRNGELKLSLGGLTKLTQLQGKSFSTLEPDIQDIFEDTKIRIFEFEIINEPKLDSSTEDKVKKEIFRRYNSGITPLNRAELDSATYDDDELTNKLKIELKEDSELTKNIGLYFLGIKDADYNRDIAKLLEFLRKYLIISSFPINTYAAGVNRKEILQLLYDVKTDNIEDSTTLYNQLITNLKTTLKLINTLSHEAIKSNKLINECLLWSIFILDEEDVDTEPLFEKINLRKLEDYLVNNIIDFDMHKSHFYKPIINRHKSMAKIITKLIGFDFSLFFKDDNFKDDVKKLRQSEKEAKLKLEELETLRMLKPDASQIPIEEMVTELYGNKYLVRPSYQRQEKINVYKASAIIESIILGIYLPPLFIFKNKDRIKEVVDGQQRLLSILGFIGKEYQDEKGKYLRPKNFQFKLKKLKILKELNGSSYADLDELYKDKILDFKLSLIEIDAKLNESFDAVDLFIRLNSKPYPIKENSFEMWNSFMDRDVINAIRSLTNENIDWFFINQRKPNTSDRMLNEELITLLVYINYRVVSDNDNTSLGFYGRDSKINCRIKEKKSVTTLLETISSDINKKNNFLDSIKTIENFIYTIKSKLDDENLKRSLDKLFNKEDTSNRRYLVNFYILFQVLQRFSERKLKEITFDDLQNKMNRIQNELKSPSKSDENQSYENYFKLMLDEVSLEL